MDNKQSLDEKIGAAWKTYRSGQNASAIQSFEQILEQESSNIDALYGLGLVLRSSGDTEGARSHWEKAIELEKKNLEALGDVRSRERERAFMNSTMLKQRLGEL